jgi:hypothetical protein
MHMQELFNQVVKECCNSVFEAYSCGRIDKAVLCCILVCCAVLFCVQPEGIATFAAALASPATGVVIAIAIALHNVSVSPGEENLHGCCKKQLLVMHSHPTLLAWLASVSI